MNIQEQLAAYRQRYGIEKAIAEEQKDPFEQKMPQAQPQQEQDLFSPQSQPQIEGVNTPRKEGYSQRLNSFAQRADADPILSRNRDEMNDKVLGIHALVQDPSNPFDEVAGEKLLNELMDKLEAEEDAEKYNHGSK